jgi:hypothetical protein
MLAVVESDYGFCWIAQPIGADLSRKLWERVPGLTRVAARYATLMRLAALGSAAHQTGYQADHEDNEETPPRMRWSAEQVSR